MSEQFTPTPLDQLNEQERAFLGEDAIAQAATCETPGIAGVACTECAYIRKAQHDFGFVTEEGALEFLGFWASGETSGPEGLAEAVKVARVTEAFAIVLKGGRVIPEPVPMVARGALGFPISRN